MMIIYDEDDDDDDDDDNDDDDPYLTYSMSKHQQKVVVEEHSKRSLVRNNAFVNKKCFLFFSYTTTCLEVIFPVSNLAWFTAIPLTVASCAYKSCIHKFAACANGPFNGSFIWWFPGAATAG